MPGWMMDSLTTQINPNYKKLIHSLNQLFYIIHKPISDLQKTQPDQSHTGI